MTIAPHLLQIAEAVLSEPYPRPGQELSNAEKWALVHSILESLASGEEEDDDEAAVEEEEVFVPYLDIFQGLEWDTVYAEWTEDALLAAMMFADLQNDVYYEFYIRGDGNEVDAANYHGSFVRWKKLKDKYAADEGRASFKHEWLQ